MNNKGAIAAFGAALLFWAGCGSNNDSRNFSYLRSASDFGVDTALSDYHCSEPQPAFANDADLCRRTKKFILHWERPEDTVGLLGYRIYLDTNHAGQSWQSLQGDDGKSAVVVLDVGRSKDSLVFFLTSQTKTIPDTLKPGSRPILALDSNKRAPDSTAKFVFALATRYADASTQGQPRYTELITKDKFPPNPFDPAFNPGSKTLTISWRRPSDPVSIFNPGLDSGTIRNYVLELRLGGQTLEARSKAFQPQIQYWVGGVDRTKEETDSLLHKNALVIGKAYYLPDSNHAHTKDRTGLDSLRVVFSNLTPRDILDVHLYAVDSSGNDNRRSMQDVRVHTTDTTQPSRPRFRDPSASVTRNSFAVEWVASRDSAELDGNQPNFGIQEYRLSRVLKRDSTQRPSPLDRLDTTVAVSPANVADSVMKLSFNFLPPGSAYRLRITAVDSSGFESLPDTVDVATEAIRFSGAESLLTCPPGFIPIPANSFFLGDTSQSAQADERPARHVLMQSYCIEPYEHRDSNGGVDSAGRFVSGVTWDEADSICRNMSPSDSSALCSEAEWERACEGFDSIPHLHGIQSETSPAVLQSSCNEATGDSAMALNLAFRNSVCLTDEGVYDMAGNLSEWVRDPYVPAAYQSLRDPDTLDHNSLFRPPDGTPADSIRRGFRGWSYLKPEIPLTQAQNLARCSNRDFAEQVRPFYRDDCRDSVPQIAVVYGPGLGGFRCLPLPDELKGSRITDIVPGRREDSLKLLIFTEGSSKIFTDPIPQNDSAFNGKKPLSAALTTRALAEITFVNSVNGTEVGDFIDATEMKDTSQAALERIFRREAVSPSWSAKKTADGRYAMRLWYAYTIMGSKPAKPYYASRAIGFRCCSRARASLAPPVAGNP